MAAGGVGFFFFFKKFTFFPAVSFIGLVTFVCSGAGVKMGSIFGAKYQAKAQVCGGIILIAIGVKILLGGLSIL